MGFSGRTDLAAEAQRLHGGAADALAACPGIMTGKETIASFPVDTVDIQTAEAGLKLGMPPGRYYSLSLPGAFHRSAADFPALVQTLGTLIRRCLPEGAHSFFLAALGNPDVTPDALGPLAAESVLVTRHLGEDPLFRSLRSVAVCRAGVLGTTGMESAFQIETLCAALRPDAVLVVDALAGAEPGGLCRSIQVTDAGIAPGSGIGNNREALHTARLGVPVVAIGAPTVTDARGFSDDPALASLFVTPRYIDSAVRHLGRLIGYGINAALQPELTLEEMNALLD